MRLFFFSIKKRRNYRWTLFGEEKKEEGKVSKSKSSRSDIYKVQTLQRSCRLLNDTQWVFNTVFSALTLLPFPLSSLIMAEFFTSGLIYVPF